MGKKQVNFRLPDQLIKALKSRAKEDNIAVTDLVIKILGQGLGISEENGATPRGAAILVEDRILDRLANLEKNITENLNGAIAKLEQRTAQLQPTQIQPKIDTQHDEVPPAGSESSVSLDTSE